MALKRLRLIQRRKALGYHPGRPGRAARLRAHHDHPLGTGRDRTAALAAPQDRPASEAHRRGVRTICWLTWPTCPDGRDGFTLVSSVPLDFSLSAACTVRMMEGFSAHDIASRREALAGLTVITGAALLRPGAAWAASLALLTRTPPGRRRGRGERAGAGRHAVPPLGRLRRGRPAAQGRRLDSSTPSPRAWATATRPRSAGACSRSPRNWPSSPAGWPTTRAVRHRPALLPASPARLPRRPCPDLGAKVIGDMTQLSTALGHYEDSLALPHTPSTACRVTPAPWCAANCSAWNRAPTPSSAEREAAHAARSAETCVAVYDEAPGRTTAGLDSLHEPGRGRLPGRQHLHRASPARHRAVPLAALRDQGPKSTPCAPASPETKGTSAAASSMRSGSPRSASAQREPAESAAVGMHALHLAAETRSTLVVNWLPRFDRALTGRYPDVPDVARFHEQASRLPAQGRPGAGRVNCNARAGCHLPPAGRRPGRCCTSMNSARCIARSTPTRRMSGETSTPPCSPSASRCSAPSQVSRWPKHAMAPTWPATASASPSSPPHRGGSTCSRPCPRTSPLNTQAGPWPSSNCWSAHRGDASTSPRPCTTCSCATGPNSGPP